MVGGLEHRQAVGLGDERSRDVLGRQVHDDQRADRDVVVDQDARRVQVVEVFNLLLVGHLAARDQRDLAGKTLGVLLLEGSDVLLGGKSGVHVLVGASRQVGEVGDLLAVHAARALVADVHAGRREGVADERVLDGADGDDGRVGRGLIHNGGIRVRRIRQALAGHVAVSGREGVAGRRVDGDALLRQLLVDGRVDRVGLVVHAGRPPQRQIDDVRVQDHHVVEGGEQRRIQERVVLGARHLADDDLRVGGRADDLVGVTGGDTGHVRPVEARAALTRGGIVVTVRVVVGEGELLVDVHAGRALPQLGPQGVHGILGQGWRGNQRGRECLVRHVHARVNDGDDLAFALLGDLVGAHHELGAQVRRVLPLHPRGPGAALGIDGGHVAHVPLALKERGRDARGLADRVQRPGGRLEGEAVQDVGVLALHAHRGVWENPGHGLVHGGQGRSAVGPIGELHDDADDTRRVLAGRIGLLRLPVLRGQRSIDVAHRGRGRGVLCGQVAWEHRRGHGRWARHHERERADKRQEGSWFLH